MITLKAKGDYAKASTWMQRILEVGKMSDLDKYGRVGVEALANATPKDTGLTASCWTYSIERTSSSVSIVWTNTNRVDGVNIAVILQYGHGTRNGGYVTGVDYINPALQPVFDDITNNVWKEVSNS